MTDPNPDTTDQDGTRPRNPPGSDSDGADGPGRALEVIKGLPMIDPPGGEVA